MQAAGRRRDIALLAIFHRQQALNMPFVLRPPANAGQRSGNVTDHVMQEGITLDIDHHQRTVTLHFHKVHLPPGGFRLTTGGAKTTEVMLANQRLGSTVHGIGIQWVTAPGHVSAL